MVAVDRRTRYTKMVIAEAFFSLLENKGFAKTTVADICREAQINRGTFYLHYEDKFALLDELIDEALDEGDPWGEDLDALCQRIPKGPHARALYRNPDTFAYVARRIIDRSASTVVPKIMERTGLSEEDARLVFLFTVHGDLAVSQQVGWEDGEEAARARSLLLSFLDGGLQGVGARARA